MSQNIEQVEKPKASPSSDNSGIRAAARDAYPIGGAAKDTGTAVHSQMASLSVDKWCNANLPHISTQDWNGNGANSSKNFPEGLTPVTPPTPPGGKGDGKAPSKPVPDVAPWHYESQPCPPTDPALTS